MGQYTEQHTPPKDWRDVDIHVMEDIARQAELYIQNQVAIAESLDQRATTISTVSIAGAVAILVVFFQNIACDAIDWRTVLMTTLVFLWSTSALLAACAQIPRKWWSSGSLPSSYYESLQNRDWDRQQIFGSYIEHLDKYCRENYIRNIKTSRIISRAAWTLAVSPFIAGVTAIMAHFF